MAERDSPDTGTAKRRVDDWLHRHIVNPIARRLSFQTLLETTGRLSGLPRQTPVGGRLLGEEFWFVSNHGTHSDYVRNVMADPRVRIRINGRWRTGTAHLIPSDDVTARLATMPAMNALIVRTMGTNNTTIRVDLAG